MNTRSPIPQDAGFARLPHEPDLQRAPDFGLDASLLNVRTIALDNAADNKELRGMAGNVLWIFDATSLSANIDIKLDHDHGLAFTGSKGFFLAGIRFNKLIVTHAAQSGETITIIWAKIPNIAFRAINPSASASNVELTKATVLNTVADVALVNSVATQILAANANRRTAFITNLAANTQTMRIGDASVTATRGIELGPGETIPVDTTEAIFGFNPFHTNSENVAVMWTED